MSTVVLKLFAGQGTGRTDRLTDGQMDKAATICFEIEICIEINFLFNIFFKIYKMYTFDQYFWLEITNTIYNETVDNIFSSTSLAHFV